MFILVGLVVGAIARAFMSGSGGMGILATILIGIAGAIVGGYLWRAIFGDTVGVKWTGSILLAMVVVWIWRRLSYGRIACILMK